MASQRDLMGDGARVALATQLNPEYQPSHDRAGHKYWYPPAVGGILYETPSPLHPHLGSVSRAASLRQICQPFVRKSASSEGDDQQRPHLSRHTSVAHFPS